MKLYIPKDSTALTGLPTHTDPAAQFDLRWMLNAVLHRRWLVIVIPLVFMALAAVYVVLRPPSYTASSQIQLTNLRLTFMREDAFFAETQPDPSFLETQLQVIRSDRVALSVLNSLKRIAPDASIQERTEALDRLRRGFSAERVGLSNVVQISFTSEDRETAARVANEFVRAYVAEQNAARLESAQAGSSWLRDRLREVGPKARIVAEALPPLHKSNLRGLFIIAAAGVIGGLLAIAFAVGWRFLDRRVLTPEDAFAAASGAQFLGAVPKIAPLKKGAERPIEEMRANEFAIRSPRLTYAVDHPLSEAWQTLRNVSTACHDCFEGKGLRYLGVTSTFAGEGRSTIAVNLALALAASGKRVLLVDADIFNPTLSRLFLPEPRAGLMELLKGEADSIASCVVTEPRTELKFLAAGKIKERDFRNVWTGDIDEFFRECEAEFDHVIFDLPTLNMLGDLRAASRHIEGFLLVIGWRQVSADSIKIGMNAAGAVPERLLGTVLNNVDPSERRWSFSPQTAFLRRQRGPTK